MTEPSPNQVHNWKLYHRQMATALCNISLLLAIVYSTTPISVDMSNTLYPSPGDDSHDGEETYAISRRDEETVQTSRRGKS